MKKGIFFLFLALIATACEIPLGETSGALHEVSGKILFPQDGARFIHGQTLNLVADAPAGCQWIEESGFILGKGQRITTNLPVGSYSVNLQYLGSTLDTVVFSVVENLGSSILIPLNKDKGTIFLPQGALKPFVANFSSVASYPLQFESNGVSGEDTPVEQVSLPIFQSVQLRIAPSGTRSRSLWSSTQKTFSFPALSSAAPAGEISTFLGYVNESFEIWYDKDIQTISTELENLFRDITDFILPRVESLWGKPDTPLFPGKVQVVLSPRLNESKNIVGFFNPADLFPLNTDPSSPHYNPGTNVGKVLYVGIPSLTDPNYSVNSIKATVAHEYQHLIHFVKKTLPLASLGNYSQYREEVFLDEGMSHLTENLVGYGVSGGNFSFCAHYLRRPEDFSLCFADRSGATDNAGLRGGMSLYLEWLFQVKGGGKWDPEVPTKFIDAGGVSFLRRIQSTKKTGVAALDEVLGIPWEQSLLKWADYLNDSALSFPSIIDPKTGELQHVQPYGGQVMVSEDKYLQFVGPKKHGFTTNFPILPFTFVFYSTATPSTSEELSYLGSATVGPAFFHYSNW